jgi:hypothetical protein
MKSIVLALLLPLSLIGAESVDLEWDASPDSTVTGYKLYHGSASRQYTNTVNVGTNLSGTVTGLVPGVSYFFAVTAHTATGLESDFSNEATYTANTSDVVLTTGSPIYASWSNVTLNGSVAGISAPYGVWFEVCQGTNFVLGNSVRVGDQSGIGNPQASMDTLRTNYVYRVCASNVAHVYKAAVRPFSTIPPAPLKIRFKVDLIESASLDSTNWLESFSSIVSFSIPPDVSQKFYRSILSYQTEP